MLSLILAEQFTGVGGASVILELLSKHSVKADTVFNILWKVKVIHTFIAIQISKMFRQNFLSK